MIATITLTIDVQVDLRSLAYSDENGDPVDSARVQSFIVKLLSKNQDILGYTSAVSLLEKGNVSKHRDAVIFLNE